MESYLPHFRTPAGEAAYRAAYQRTLALWPAEHQSMQVETSFGITHLIRLGPPTNPPLLMMHGFSFSAAMWYPTAPALADLYCIYAPDVPDQLGLSQLSRPLQTPENYAAWVEELLDALGITQAPFIGHSYGGWLSTNFAMRCPERVTRLTLIAPAATFTPLSWQFYVRGILGAATRQDWVIYGMIKWMTTSKQVRGMEIVEQFRVGMKNMAQIPAGFPTVFPPQEFQSLGIPVQLIIGDHEVVYNKKPPAVVEIARRLVPHIQVAIIPNGGHAVNIDQEQATNAALINFHGVDQNRAAINEGRVPAQSLQPA